MEEFLNYFNSKYDYILFDSPLIAVTDAFVLMNHEDQFILVIRAGVTQKGALERILTTGEQTNMQITGVVLNDVSESFSYGSGYYYNYYQYYYGDKAIKLILYV